MAEADREKWNARYGEEAAMLEPSPFLAQLSEVLPRHGRALDVAGGAGRNARWLSRHGLSVTVADISDVGLARAARDGFATVVVDFDVDPLPEGPWDVIFVNHFLHRPLFAQAPSRLTPGGLFVVAHPTVTNLERNPHPGRKFLLEPGELRELARGLVIVSFDEGWRENGWHEARLVARRP
jgi:SAM-dependent methyltransferase